MGKKKLQRFAEVAAFPHVFEFGFPQIKEGFRLKGKWSTDFFKNDQPIVVELGCGKGEYTVGLAQKYPARNFIGVDIKGNRIWRGAKTVLENKINNAAFLRTRIDFIESCFKQDEVSEIWITFPDPQPQLSRERKRLTSPKFLDRYKNVLKPGGIIHLKTDNKSLWEYTLEVIRENKYQLLVSTSDLYSSGSPELVDAASIQTFYENLFSKQGFKICYLSFRFYSNLKPET
ncbi:MAG: tRNA (guanosine(46)-N7)-methyltransferase TrmB [Bacteroidetes bacterium]|nr:tRNA (guanosine(46)-N7)-methyltransferase TrmB [Bacteroidota bacterium]